MPHGMSSIFSAKCEVVVHTTCCKEVIHLSPGRFVGPSHGNAGPGLVSLSLLLWELPNSGEIPAESLVTAASLLFPSIIICQSRKLYRRAVRDHSFCCLLLSLALDIAAASNPIQVRRTTNPASKRKARFLNIPLFLLMPCPTTKRHISR